MEAAGPRCLDPSLRHFVEIDPFGPAHVDFSLLLRFQGGIVSISWGFLGSVACGVLLGPLGGLGSLHGSGGRLVLGLLKTGVPPLDPCDNFAMSLLHHCISDPMFWRNLILGWQPLYACIIIRELKT